MQGVYNTKIMFVEWGFPQLKIERWRLDILFEIQQCLGI
jgi:hypothetical protein